MDDYPFWKWWEPIELTVEEAAELRALMDAPPGSPGKLNWEPKAIPEGDPSLLQ